MIENQEMITCGFLGEQEVGKTSLINKYFHKTQCLTYNPTIAVQISYSCFECDEGTLLRVKCWDTSGQNKYKNMVCYHLKSVDIVVIMFDFTNLASFTKVDEWASRLKNEKISPKVLYLIGNKIDLVRMDNSLRKVTTRQAQQKAKEISALYAEISVANEDTFQFLNEAFEQILTSRAQKAIQEKKLKYNFDLEATKIIQKNSANSPCQCIIF